jgi:hypothetical protein
MLGQRGANWANPGRCARGKKAGGLARFGPRKEGGLARNERREEREKRRKEGFLFFLNSFQNRFSNFQTSIKQKSMHSNHGAQTLIISKLF